VKALSATNRGSETRAIAEGCAAAVLRRNREWAGQRTEKRLISGGFGQRRPSQRSQNPRQPWGERAKKNQPRTVGFFISGGAEATPRGRSRLQWNVMSAFSDDLYAVFA
jgi:hypothetical protein